MIERLWWAPGVWLGSTHHTVFRLSDHLPPHVLTLGICHCKALQLHYLETFQLVILHCEPSHNNQQQR